MFTTVTTFEGNLATAPELRFTANKGIPVAEFVVLVNRRERDAAGEWIDAEPTRHRVQAYGSLAENVATLEVGSTVLVHGQVETERWADKMTGEERTGDRVVADAIGASLRFATVTIHKTSRGQA